MTQNSKIQLIVAAGFAAVVVTLIGCTYVLDRSLTKILRNSGNDDVVSAIESEGSKIRDAIKGVKPAEPDFVQPWIIPKS